MVLHRFDNSSFYSLAQIVDLFALSSLSLCPFSLAVQVPYHDVKVIIRRKKTYGRALGAQMVVQKVHSSATFELKSEASFKTCLSFRIYGFLAYISTFLRLVEQ